MEPRKTEGPGTTGPDLDPEVLPWAQDEPAEMAEDQLPPEPLITLE